MSGVPCSLLSPLIRQAESSGQPRYVAAANEGDAVAVAAGAYLGGSQGAVLMQNSGLGNAVNPLTSMSQTFEIPSLMIISLRGDPQGPPDQPQHQLMGQITTDLLELMKIPWSVLSAEPDRLDATLEQALTPRGSPFALVVRSATFVEGATHGPTQRAGRELQVTRGRLLQARVTRPEFLKELVGLTCPEEDLLVATTGHTGRELYGWDRANHLYMVGSMGCASSLGLGLALTQPEKRVLVLDGDAALTMRLGSLATIGHQLPPNLIHLVFDNGSNQSTGGQLSPSHGIDFCGAALACGYRRAHRLDHPSQLAVSLEGEGPAMLQVSVRSEPQARPPRPEIEPCRVARRFRTLHS